MGHAIPFRLRRGARRTLEELDRLLDDDYGAPEGDLDNKEDPLDEAVYIVLSFRTDLDRVKLVWERLRTIFPAWQQLARAPQRRVVRALRIGGLQEQKARTIRKLLEAVKEATGAYSLDVLRCMEDDEAERFLIRLPGLSWKAARCVFLYSLRRDVFPVDGNSFRSFKRIGLIGTRSVYRRRGPARQFAGCCRDVAKEGISHQPCGAWPANVLASATGVLELRRPQHLPDARCASR